MIGGLPADVAIEHVYLIEATYAPDGAERRAPYRAEHVSRAAELRDRGIVVEAGAFTDVSASILIVRAPDAEAALALARDDVYWRNGVWVDLRCRPFGLVVRPGEVRSPHATR